jgi:hypothetical protein
MSHPPSHEDRYALRENHPATTSASGIAISVSARIPSPHFLDSLRISPRHPRAGGSRFNSVGTMPTPDLRQHPFTNLVLNTGITL